MGAYDAELARLGWRTPRANREAAVPTEDLGYRLFAALLHVAETRCVGSCGSKCPNHHCPAHNGEKYKSQKDMT